MVPARDLVRSVPVRSTPAYEIASVERGGTRVLTITPRVSSEAAHRALSRLVEAHCAIDHPRVPRGELTRDEEGRTIAVLDCPAERDGFDVVGRLASLGLRISWARGDWFIDALRGVLAAAHASRLDGEPIVLGMLGLANVFFALDGRWWVIGFGANVPITAPDGSIVTAEPVFMAPEIAARGRATPSSDLVATLMLKRSFASMIELSAPLARALRGEALESDREIHELAMWFDTSVVGALPGARPPHDVILERIARFRALIGEGYDEEGFVELVRRVIAGPSFVAAPIRTITIRPDSCEVTLDGAAPLRLGPSLFRIVDRLANARELVSTHDLIEAGWPGEHLAGGSGESRVYTAIRRLRKLGLDDAIEHSGGGYRLAPRFRVVTTPADHLTGE